MIACRPGAFSQAEKTTTDLLRLFTTNFLKGGARFKSFVCDFIEGETGAVYLLQVKAFQVEEHSEEAWNPSTAYSPTKEPEKPLRPCEVKLLCARNNPYCEDLRRGVETVCREIGFWNY